MPTEMRQAARETSKLARLFPEDAFPRNAGPPFNA